MNLGDKVIFSRRLRREKSWLRTGIFNTAVRKWVEFKHEPMAGIIVGRRNIYNGTVVDIDEMSVFEPDQVIGAWLVVVNMRDNPIYIPLDEPILMDELEECKDPSYFYDKYIHDSEHMKSVWEEYKRFKDATINNQPQSAGLLPGDEKEGRSPIR